MHKIRSNGLEMESIGTKESIGYTMIKIRSNGLEIRVNRVHNDKIGQMVLKGVNRIHNDKIGSMVLKGVNWLHIETH